MAMPVRHGPDGPSRAASLLAAIAHGKKVGADAIRLLEMDHRQVEAWFHAYTSLSPSQKPALLRQICLALKAHAAVEEEIFYPTVREATQADDIIDHGLQEHAEVKQLVAELEQKQQADGDADDKVNRLRQMVDDHVRDEEQDLFPKVRGTSLDLLQLGQRMAARRMAAFAEMTGHPGSDLDRHPPDAPRAPESLAEPSAAREAFARCLRDAHAMEKQSLTILEKEIGRIENYPEVDARMRAHLEETREQLARLDHILEDLGESPSAMKDVAGSFSGWFAQSWFEGTDDEILKGALSAFAYERFEEAAYEQLIAMGELTGDATAIRLLQQSQREERAMIAWLQQAMPSLAQRYLELSGDAGRPVGR